jgi:FkbM family methyltransferase
LLKKIESLINNSPFYNVIRHNRLTDFIIETKNRKTQKSVAFFSSFLDVHAANNLVYDIGANKGNKVKALLRMGYKVIAVEPEKKALSTLSWRFSKNKNVTIVENGVSDKKAELTIHIAGSRSGLNTLSDKWVNSLEKEQENRWHKKHSFKDSYTIEVTTLDDLFSKYGIPYFIKIDVEGYENKVIKGMSRMPAFISFETNLPEFLEETIGCIQHLKSLSDKIVFNYSLSDKLVSGKWMTGEEMISIIRDPLIRYMEIVGRSVHA